MVLREIHSEEFKPILVDMLKTIDKFCSDNNLKYFLAYGTLLGAVRHKGFIPWDDDIDIIMPRSDYQKFIQYFNKGTQSHTLQVVDCYSTNNYYLPFAKLIHTGTVVLENVNNAIPLGVFIDVFPLDNMTDQFKKSKKFFNSISLYRNLLTLKNLKQRRINNYGIR